MFGYNPYNNTPYDPVTDKRNNMMGLQSGGINLSNQGSYFGAPPQAPKPASPYDNFNFSPLLPNNGGGGYQSNMASPTQGYQPLQFMASQQAMPGYDMQTGQSTPMMNAGRINAFNAKREMEREMGAIPGNRPEGFQPNYGALGMSILNNRGPIGIDTFLPYFQDIFNRG